MAWMDDAIDQLMWQMQMQSMLGKVGLPPRDEYIPDPNRHYVAEEDIQRGRLEDLGIYGNPQRASMDGDVVLSPEREIPNFNVDQTIWPDPGKRAYADLQNQYSTGGIEDEAALTSLFNNQAYQGDVSRGLAEQLEQGGPSYLRKISDVRSDPITQLMLQMQLPQLMGGGATPGQGGYDPFKSDLPQAVRDSINLQPSYADGSGVPAPNPLLQNILFGGEKGAQNVPAGAGPGLPVDAAKQLEQSGAKAPEIFQQTGWYRGPDGAWKWTLSDQGAALNKDAFTTYYSGDPSGMSKEDLAKNAEVRLKRKGPEDTHKLTDILNHPALYETYPNFKNTTVKLLPPPPGGGVGGGIGSMGSFDAANNELNIRDDRSGREVLSTILHELQHGVQSTEGFGKGGSWTEFYPSDLQTGQRRPTQEEQNSAFQNYLRLAGETEARQVQKQFETRNWSQLPTRMEGFPTPEQQWVRQGNATTLPPGKSYQLAPSAPGDPVGQLMMQMQLQQLMGGNRMPF